MISITFVKFNGKITSITFFFAKTACILMTFEINYNDLDSDFLGKLF
jgi:hypothetical protein